MPPKKILFSANPQHPKITTILTDDIGHVMHSLRAGITYNSSLLTISVTSPYLPAVGEILPRKVDEVHSVESTKTQILDLATALSYAQDSFMGKIGGIPMKGATFLTQLAISHGVFLQDHQTSQTQTKPFVKTADIAEKIPKSSRP